MQPDTVGPHRPSSATFLRSANAGAQCPNDSARTGTILRFAAETKETDAANVIAYKQPNGTPQILRKVGPYLLRGVPETQIKHALLKHHISPSIDRENEIVLLCGVSLTLIRCVFVKQIGETLIQQQFVHIKLTGETVSVVPKGITQRPTLPPSSSARRVAVPNAARSVN